MLKESSLWNWLKTGPQIEYELDNKAKYKKLGSRFLKDVERELRKKTQVKSAKVGFNPGGVAVCGDHSIYAMFDENIGVNAFFGDIHMCDWVVFRTIKSEKDYSGGSNNNVSLDILASPEAFAEKMLQVARINKE